MPVDRQSERACACGGPHLWPFTHTYGCPNYKRHATRDDRYAHLSSAERLKAIRESNQRAGGDPYGG